ncbi:DUF7059 domain-containing protein [Angustibacter luteus]|uniref:Methyltransferase n=1 Tax=Angustibacter luteus TaxID=658456 RepID=A0ABW1JDN6_9ACTN
MSRPAPRFADDQAARDLAADLAPFTVDAVGDLLGPQASSALLREEPIAARRALRGDDRPLAVLVRLFVLGEPVAAAALDAALPRTGSRGAADAGLVELIGSDASPVARPLVDLGPHAADDVQWWLACDLGELATGGPLPADHVLGVGGASTTLAQWTVQAPVGSVLDLGTGCGVQAFHAARHATSVLGTDSSERALAFADFNARLNAAVVGGPFADRRLQLRRGDLLEPVAGERFDLVVSNPPFVITPRAAGVPLYEYRDGGLAGDEVVRRLVGGVVDVLAPGGVAQLLGNWEHRVDDDGQAQDWAQRVREWLPDGVQAWVVQREVQDPAQYAQTWARDGGHLPGSGAHDDLVEGWLDDFEARGVAAVGFGVVTLRRAEPGWHRVEELRGPLDGPMGDVVAAVLDAETWVRGTSDEDLLAAHLTVAADVTEERHALPGAADPQVILLRQGGGLQRVVRADTALAGLVGACDGELSVGQIVAALAQLLEEPEADLRARLLPDVRHLVADLLLQHP